MDYLTIPFLSILGTVDVDIIVPRRRLCNSPPGIVGIQSSGGLFMKIKVVVHHCELAYKNKETGKPVYRLYFEIGEYEYAWVRSTTPAAAGTEIVVVAEKLITNDFNNGRLTFKVA